MQFIGRAWQQPVNGYRVGTAEYAPVIAADHGLLFTVCLIQTQFVAVGVGHIAPCHHSHAVLHIAHIEYGSGYLEVCPAERQQYVAAGFLYIVERQKSVIRPRRDSPLGHIGRAGKRVAARCARGCLAVGLHYVHPLVACHGVHRVVLPCESVNVYVPHQHTVPRNVCVPTCLLAVFEHEKLPGLVLDRYAVAHVAVLQVGYSDYCVGTGVQFRIVSPAQFGTLKGREERRSVHVVVVRTVGHGVESTGRECGIAVLHVVEVGQSEHVAELVGERTYAGYLSAAAASYLVAARIAAHLYAIEHKTPIAKFLVSVRVRPDSTRSAAISLAASGIDDIHVVHIAVVVVVV